MTNVLEWAFTDVKIQMAMSTLKVKQSAHIGDFVPGTVTFYECLGLGNATQTAYPLLLLIFQLSLETRRKHSSRPFPITFSIFILLYSHPPFPPQLGTKNSNQYSYRVFFSEFLPSLFLEMLHRTVKEDKTTQKSEYDVCLYNAFKLN